MKQQKPILHARDHLPGGADPLPRAMFEQTVPPIDENIPAEGAVDEAAGDDWHWWRFRESSYPWTGASAPGETPDVATNDVGFKMLLAMNVQAPSELTALQPGPSSESVAMLRTQNPTYNPNNYWTGSAALGHVEWGQAATFTLLSWFKLADLANYDLFNLNSAAHPTYVMSNPDGSLTLHRDGTDFATVPGLVQAGVWAYIGLAVGGGRVRLYVNPGPPEPAAYDPTIGTTFPFATPMAMDTWGLALGDYTAAALADRLTSNGFTSVAVQLNYVTGAGHAAYISQLTADVATLKAAGLQVVGWGEVDGDTGADLAAIDVDGWLPQVEGDGQRTSLITALGAGVGSGLPKAAVTNMGGLDDATKVTALASAGIDAFAIEVYAGDGFSDVTAKLAHGSSVGMDMQNTIPMLGTYRGEIPDDYAGFDEGVLPNYGIYNVPQTSEAAWAAFGELNQGTVLMSGAVIDEPDPASASNTGTLTIGSTNSSTSFNNGSHGVDGAFQGSVTEVDVYEHALSGNRVRDLYLSTSYGDTGTVPPHEEIPAGALLPAQIQPGTDGQHLVTAGGVATWAADTGGGGGAGMFVTGSGPPGAGAGTDGSIYLDSSSFYFWGPKASGAWPAAAFARAIPLSPSYADIRGEYVAPPPSPPAFVAAGTLGADTTAGNTIAVAMPAGVAAGDLLLAIVNATNTFIDSAPTLGASGWTLLDAGQAGNNAYDRQFVFSRTADGSEGSTVTFTWTGGSYPDKFVGTGFAVAYRNAQLDGTDVSGSFDCGAGLAYTTSSIPTTAAGLVVLVATDNASTDRAVSATSSVTVVERFEGYAANSVYGSNAYAEEAAAAAAAAYTFTVTYVGQVGIRGRYTLVALKPR